MKEMFTDNNPLRSDDFKLPADDTCCNAPGNTEPIGCCSPPFRTLVCKNCGGVMYGDGFKVVVHCENVDISTMCAEPDANPIYCDLDTK